MAHFSELSKEEFYSWDKTKFTVAVSKHNVYNSVYVTIGRRGTYKDKSTGEEKESINNLHLTLPAARALVTKLGAYVAAAESANSEAKSQQTTGVCAWFVNMK